MVPTRKMLELGVILPAGGQAFLDQALVAGVGELVVAAQGVVFGQPFGVVGMIAVGGAARGHHQAAHAVSQTGSDHVFRAADVDRVLECAVVLGPRGDDRRQVDDDFDPVLGDHLGELRVADVEGAVTDPRQAIALRDLPQVGGDDLPFDGGVGEAGDELRAEVASGSGHQDSSRQSPAHLPAGSWCISLNWRRPGAHMWATGSTSTWTTAARPANRQRSRAGWRSPGSETRSP